MSLEDRMIVTGRIDRVDEAGKPVATLYLNPDPPSPVKEMEIEWIRAYENCKLSPSDIVLLLAVR